MTEKSLYDRLGGVFAIAAVIDHSAMRSCGPIVGRAQGHRPCGNGTPTIWADCRA